MGSNSGSFRVFLHTIRVFGYFLGNDLGSDLGSNLGSDLGSDLGSNLRNNLGIFRHFIAVSTKRCL